VFSLKRNEVFTIFLIVETSLIKKMFSLAPIGAGYHVARIAGAVAGRKTNVMLLKKNNPKIAETPGYIFLDLFKN
jgi:hypothetical protein